jgi:hypothetical protein
MMSKTWWSQRGHKWCHNMAHTSCMLDKRGYTHAGTLTETRADKYVILYFSTAILTRRRLSITLYVHWLACLACYGVLIADNKLSKSYTFCNKVISIYSANNPFSEGRYYNISVRNIRKHCGQISISDSKNATKILCALCAASWNRLFFHSTVASNSAPLTWTVNQEERYKKLLLLT